MSKSYSELCTLKTFAERFQYLKLSGRIGEETFGSDRYLNQAFYRSKEWLTVRRRIIIRDNACDLGVEGFNISDQSFLIIHHINPITVQDILDRDFKVFDPENLITVSKTTHNALHYGDDKQLIMEINERRPNDTCPWKL